MPQPLSQEDIETIERSMHADFHTRHVVCVVCDEICPEIETETFDIEKVPTSFYKVLKAPSGSNEEAPMLPDELLRQYDVSQYFAKDFGLQHLLLSPRGILQTENGCQASPENFSNKFISATIPGVREPCDVGKFPNLQ